MKGLLEADARETENVDALRVQQEATMTRRAAGMMLGGNAGLLRLTLGASRDCLMELQLSRGRGRSGAMVVRLKLEADARETEEVDALILEGCTEISQAQKTLNFEICFSENFKL